VNRDDQPAKPAIAAEMASVARAIRLAIFDVDGVFTDGRIFFGPQGEEVKVFHVRDGFGVKRLAADGIELAIISGRKSDAVARRMSELGIEHVFQGDHDKVPLFERLIKTVGVTPEQVAYMGDDLPDLPVMELVGLPAAPANADPEVIAASKWVARQTGGLGAVREFCDFLLAARRGGGD
jgi:3-deoxy-D-manno-octulosonate 8-phosphate phosphatase (KDO 8-P phosphatase)